MKTYLLQTLLLMFGITSAHGQVNLSGMPNARKARSGISPQIREERTECGISLGENQEQYHITPENDIDSNGLRHGTYLLYN